MTRFTIDFMGLLNAHRMKYAKLAKLAGVPRDRGHVIATGGNKSYHRGKVARMLKVLGVAPYPPIYYDERVRWVPLAQVPPTLDISTLETRNSKADFWNGVPHDPRKPTLYCVPDPWLAVDFEGLLELREIDNFGVLVRWTKLRHHRIYYMIRQDPEEYNREVLGAVLRALDVNLYPPFFLEDTGEPSNDNQRFKPARHYYRARKPDPRPGQRDGQP